VVTQTRDGQPTILWDTPGGSAALAAWVGSTTRRIHRIMMVGPSHYMTLSVGDFNAALQIRAPQ
ncbi:MAG: hypothetical protein ACREUD_06360, partial [Gammaproteobacteria bacterium]